MRGRRTLALRALMAAVAAVALAVAFQAPGGAGEQVALKWYKGNLHAHTLNSDGDSTPSDVATWYREQRYHFLVLSDHNYLTEIAGLNAVHGAKEKFLLIAGEEVTDEFGDKPLHLNAYNPSRLIEPAHGESVVDTIQRNVDAIRAAGGLPSLNHPNFGWVVTSEELKAIRDLGLFEVYNGHPMVNNPGGGGWESLEEMWDAALTAGRRLYGIAVDDAHHFKQFGRDLSNPGRGWVVVGAKALEAAEITGALAAGDFYASTGVELSDVQVTADEYRVTIRPKDGLKYTTVCLGAGGRVLATSYDTTASYRFQGGERYVRARVEASSGDRAWTQPAWR